MITKTPKPIEQHTHNVMRKIDHPLYAQTESLQLGTIPHPSLPRGMEQQGFLYKRPESAPQIKTAERNQHVRVIDASQWREALEKRQYDKGNSSPQKQTDVLTPDLVNQAIKQPQSTEQVKAQLVEAGKPSVTTPEMSSKRNLTEKTPSSKPEQSKVVTHAEQVKLFEQYADTYLKSRGEHQSDTFSSDKLNMQLRDNPELRADIEQAVRVLHAYEAVMNTDGYNSTGREVQSAVLKALDQKVTHSHVIDEVTSEVAEGFLDLTSSESEPSHSEPAQETESSEYGMAEPVTEVSSQAETNRKLKPEIDYTLSEEMSTEMYDQQETQKEQTSSATVSQQKLQALVGDEEQEDEKESAEGEFNDMMDEQALEELQLQLRIAYERDIMRDEARFDVAVQIAEQIAHGKEDANIPGEAFLQIMSQPDLYHQLKSTIAPGPDEYLTQIIETLASRDYSSVGEVKAMIRYLVRAKKSIRESEELTVDLNEVATLQNSTRYPRLG